LSQEERIRSRWWYLLPIFFQIFGGVIAYFVLRNDDPKKAKNCLWLGIVLTAIKIGLFVVFISICTSIGACAEFHDEFMTGIKQGTMGQGMMGSEMTGGMMQDPQAMNQWMNTMMNDPTTRQQMMDNMMNNPQMMQSMMENQQMMQMMTPNLAEEITELYNKDLNPRQIEYPNIVGFNDLHIGAIRHLEPNGDNSKLDTLVHHHCKVYDDMTASCLLFPTGMGDQDKPYGIEYIISSEEYAKLSDEEKLYWHYHLTELPRAKAILPDLTPEELAILQPTLDETYGKVYYFWDVDDKYPTGEPSVLVIQNLPDQ
jgi:hypothetical protein